MGDVLMTTPAQRALKGPGRHVTLLTSPSGASAAALVPEVDEVIVYGAPWLKATPPKADAGHEFAIVERLRAGGYDAAAVFTVYSQNPLPSATLCWLAGIPLRLAHCRENPYQILTDWVPEPEPDPPVRHEVRRQLELVAAVGARAADERLSIRVPEASRRAVDGLLESAGVDPERPWLVVHPGATAPSRRYPTGHFAEAARSLADDHGYQVVFTGSRDEFDLIAEVRAAMGRPSAVVRAVRELTAGVADPSPLLGSFSPAPMTHRPGH